MSKKQGLVVVLICNMIFFGIIMFVHPIIVNQIEYHNEDYQNKLGKQWDTCNNITDPANKSNCYDFYYINWEEQNNKAEYINNQNIHLDILIAFEGIWIIVFNFLLWYIYKFEIREDWYNADKEFAQILLVGIIGIFLILNFTGLIRIL